MSSGAGRWVGFKWRACYDGIWEQRPPLGLGREAQVKILISPRGGDQRAGEHVCDRPFGNLRVATTGVDFDCGLGERHPQRTTSSILKEDTCLPPTPTKTTLAAAEDKIASLCKAIEKFKASAEFNPRAERQQLLPGRKSHHCTQDHPPRPVTGTRHRRPPPCPRGNGRRRRQPHRQQLPVPLRHAAEPVSALRRRFTAGGNEKTSRARISTTFSPVWANAPRTKRREAWNADHLEIIEDGAGGGQRVLPPAGRNDRRTQRRVFWQLGANARDVPAPV